MNLNPIISGLTVVGILLLAWLAALMVQRRLYVKYPLFFVYIFSSIAVLLVASGAALQPNQKIFFKTYWVAEALSDGLGLLAMYESFRKVLEGYFVSRKWFFLIPTTTILVILFVAIWTLRQHLPVQADLMGLLYVSFDLAADYMLSGLFGLFVILLFFWQAGWQRYPFGIMKGFGFFSIVAMLADLLRSQFGTRWDFFFSYAPAVAYILGCLIWLGAFLGPEERKLPGGPGSAVDLDEILQLLGKLTKVIK